MSSFLTYLTLGRVSNLSTVWSNVLCALILTGAFFNPVASAHLFVGLSLLYIGGMYMNDFFDAAHDQAAGKKRPIVTGAITQKRVRLLTALLIGSGLASIAMLGQQPTRYALLLVVLIAAYNVTHKRWSGAFLLMAGCRASIYLVVGATVDVALSLPIILAASAQFLYVAGVTILARNEENSRAFNPIGIALIALTLVGAVVYHFTTFDIHRAATVAILIGWVALSLNHARTSAGIVPGKAIGPLLAGLPLLDLLVLATLTAPTIESSTILAAFFAIALLAQRFIPAS